MDKLKATMLLAEIKGYLTAGNPVWDVDDIAEACEMAIEALSDETSTNTSTDLVSRSDVIDAIDYIGEDEGLGMVDLKEIVESLPSETCDDCIWHVCNYNKVDWDGEDGYISRQDALDILDDFEADIEVGKRDAYKTHREKLLSIHSAYHPLCALADRACPFQGKEFAWCLTCPHISEEDRALVKKAVEEPKTGTWKKISPAIIYECSECGRMVMTGDIESYKFCHGCGARMMNGGEEE